MPLPVAEELIKRLGLIRHPEGGWFCETYRSNEQVAAQALPDRYNGDRPFCTAIYFLLEQGDFSALHRIKSDEIWHFYTGTPLRVHVISPEGTYHGIILGPDPTAGQRFQAVVPAGCWFGAEVTGTGSALVGCTVAPGFDFTDFEMADQQNMLEQYPDQATLVCRLTRRS
jgi:uncharacterized protein